jgi:predicted flap endonuclease-1-like 5' DNA nuclease
MKYKLDTASARLRELEQSLGDSNERLKQKDDEIARLRMELAIAPGEDRDDLKQIHGIGPAVEKRLNEYGVRWFKQIALWSREDIVAFERNQPQFLNRAERDEWIASAKEEHRKKYSETL